MAAGRGRARIVEAEREAAHGATNTDRVRTVDIGTERGDIDETRGSTGPERTAHAWEVDEADSWEPVVPDTWDLPADRQPSEAPTSAGWSDAARSEDEWVDAARHDGSSATGAAAEGQPAATVTDDARVPYLEAVAAEYLGEEPAPTRAPRPPRVTGHAATAEERERGPAGPNAARMALGLATLAAQRLRGGVPAGDGLVTGVGLMQETANGLRELGRRVLGPASRMATGTVKGASLLPVAGTPVRVALRTRARLAAAASDALARGQETVEAGRADAERMLAERADRTLRWAADHAVAPLVDQLAPRVAEHILPRIIAEVAGRPSRGRENETGERSRGRENETGGRSGGREDETAGRGRR